jgi:hypothetical protein
VFKKLSKLVQKKVNYGAYMDTEMKAGKFVADSVPELIGVWKMAVDGLLGKGKWQDFTARTAFLGYLFAWCDILAMATDAEKGGNGAVMGYSLVLGTAFPGRDVQETVQQTMDLFNAMDEEIRLGAAAGHMDYNIFASKEIGNKAPINLLKLIEKL